MTSLDHTTNSPTAVVVDVVEGPEAPKVPISWRRRPLVLTAATVVLVGVVVAAWAGYQAWDARGEQALVTATSDLSAAAADLKGAVVAGDAALAESEGRVGDEAVRTDLADVLTQASSFSAAVPEGSRQVQTDAAVSLTTEARDLTAAVAGATALTVESVEAWELEQAVAAHETASDRLTRATAAAQQTLATSEEQVADNAVREQLLAQIQAATAVEPVVVDESAIVVDQTAALEAATTELTTTADALDAARQDVTDAQGAWQVEQERIAAEQAEQARIAAESASAQRASAGSQGSSSNSSTPTSRSTTSGPSSAASSGSSSPSSSAGSSGATASAPGTSTGSATPTAPAAPPTSGGGRPSHQDVAGGSIGDHVGDGWVITDGGGQSWCGNTSGNPSVDC